MHKTHPKNKLYIIGHRGGAGGLAPENTVAAIKKGLANGVDEIEIDVRVSKDGKVVVHHDRFISDASGAHHDIRDHRYSELQDYKADVATLGEAIEAVGKKVPLQIEVKRGEATAPVASVLHAYLAKGWQASDFLLGSKSQHTLMTLHREFPAIPTVVIEPFSGVRANIRARQLGTKRVSMRSWWLWSGFIRPVSRSGYLLYAYTLDNPAKARRWRTYGLAGVITDHPERYR
jgi:glycerophosphoryl diester phosphodiesterase